MQRHHNRNIELTEQAKISSRGYTIIELTLAMTFIAFIMIFVITVLLQFMSIYNKGVAMSQINRTGSQVSDDLNSKARFASVDSVQYVQDNRRLCVGGISYLWNTDQDRSNDGGIKNYFETDATAEAKKNTNLGIVRVVDDKAVYCSDKDKMPKPSDDSVTSLVGKNVSILVFDVQVDSTMSMLKTNIVLSTGGVDKPVSVDGQWKCLQGGASGQPNAYCAFAEFNNLVYMRGGM